MMSESVTVTVQDGRAAGKPEPGQTNVGGLTLNVPYFRSIPGILKLVQLVEESEKENISGSNAQSSSKSEEEIEINQEELKRQEKKLKEWEKLSIFLKNYVEEMNDAISFNASTNLYVNDVTELDKDEGTFVFTEVQRACKERVSLIDLKTIGDKYLLSASWHCEMNDVIVCTYLNKGAKSSSLIALWSLHSPLQPKVILNCREKISTVSFCPLRNYTNIIIGGCLDGKIVVWETMQHWLENAEDLFEKKGILEGPLIKEAKIAESADEAQTLSITSIQWFPSWCRLEPDGNFQKNTAAEVKAYFATSSADGSIFFWSLPRSLATPAKVRSPLHLTISPIYQLMIEENAEKSSQRISVTCFCLPLAKNEESSSMSIRDQSDLERLRKIFLGTDSGEVLCCTWEGQTFSIEVTDKEVCKTLSRSSVHDGLVKTMAKSPHLDDVFLTVGGRVFAIWKEDFPEAPVFRRRCKKDIVYGEGCWSGRSGIFVLTRLDGCFEIWDLKLKADKPIQLQTLSDKITPSIWASPATYRKPQLALLNGHSTLHIFVEPEEERKDEDLERLEWFEEFVWRETKRKFDFYRWQSEYLKENPMALRRKSEREQAEAARKHQEAREKFLKVFGIICMTCGSPGWAAGHWFLFVAVTAFIMSLLWTIVYLFSLREMIKIPINWILTELLNTGIYTILYFTAFIAELAWAFHAPYIVAGVFGIFNTLAYGAGTYFLYLEYRNSQQ